MTQRINTAVFFVMTYKKLPWKGRRELKLSTGQWRAAKGVMQEPVVPSPDHGRVLSVAPQGWWIWIANGKGKWTALKVSCSLFRVVPSRMKTKVCMINSPPVQRYSKFWSSSPNYFLLFMFQSPHPLCLVFIVSASQYNQVEYVFSI